jgi:hypothetical protein
LPDPGAVVEVPDTVLPCTGPISQNDRDTEKVKLARATLRLHERSDTRRLRAINKKRAKLGRPPLDVLPN